MSYQNRKSAVDLAKYTVLKSTSIVDAMSQINVNASGIVFCVDEKGRLTGSLTDGDIRRWILKTGVIDADISEIVNNNPKYIIRDDRSDTSEAFQLERYRNTDIRVIPVVNPERVVVDIIFQNPKPVIWSDCLKGIPVVIMAGGKGTRLYPYTKILPKPLIPMGDIPIVERIIDKFNQFGASDFYMTLNYRKEMIKAYFNDSEHAYTIHYVEEDKPLGTAGSIRLISNRFDTSVIISNCDILIDADYEGILRYHQKNGNQMTIVSSVKKIVVPYGVLNTIEGGEVIGMEEKPEMSYFINTGMYVIEPEIIELIPEDTFFHMTDLAQALLDQGMKVGTYPISEDSFLDMGEFEEMKRMEEKLRAEEQTSI